MIHSGVWNEITKWVSVGLGFIAAFRALLSMGCMFLHWPFTTPLPPFHLFLTD